MTEAKSRNDGKGGFLLFCKPYTLNYSIKIILLSILPDKKEEGALGIGEKKKKENAAMKGFFASTYAIFSLKEGI